MISVDRYHDISCGHRVVGHEGKCRFLHGHNYRIHFTCECPPGLDEVGRVIDFGVIKSRLCMWLEDNWDHKFLAWEQDRMLTNLTGAATSGGQIEALLESFVWVPFNPTAENMAEHLLKVVGPKQLEGTDVILTIVRVEETRKCSATAWRM